MTDMHFLELGAGALVLWVMSLIAMWFLIDRKSRPGSIRSVAAIESMMLSSIAILIAGIGLVLKGYGVLD